MKKLAPTKIANALRWMFNHSNELLVEKNIPKKSARQKVVKTAWFAGEVQLNDKNVDKMEEKGFIEPDNAGGYRLTNSGSALGEMISGQKTFDFTTNLWMEVKSYDEDPLVKPDLTGFTLPLPAAAPALPPPQSQLAAQLEEVVFYDASKDEEEGEP